MSRRPSVTNVKASLRIVRVQLERQAIVGARSVGWRSAKAATSRSMSTSSRA
jgi:hypothetical protein